jgi:hypothetical protein
MAKVIVGMTMSLDGFINDRQGSAESGGTPNKRIEPTKAGGPVRHHQE